MDRGALEIDGGGYLGNTCSSEAAQEKQCVGVGIRFQLTKEVLLHEVLGRMHYEEWMG